MITIAPASWESKQHQNSKHWKHLLKWMQQWWQCQLSLKQQGKHDDSQNRKAAWFHLIASKVTVNPAIKDEICTVKLEMAEWRKQWFSEQWMSTNALLHLLVPWSSAMLWWMTRKRNMFRQVVLGSVLVVIIDTLFCVFQLIKLMLGAFLAHFLHFVVDWSIVQKSKVHVLTGFLQWMVCCCSVFQKMTFTQRQWIVMVLLGGLQADVVTWTLKVLLSLSRSLQVWCIHWEIFENECHVQRKEKSWFHHVNKQATQKIKQNQHVLVSGRSQHTVLTAATSAGWETPVWLKHHGGEKSDNVNCNIVAWKKSFLLKFKNVAKRSGWKFSQLKIWQFRFNCSRMKNVTATGSKAKLCSSDAINGNAQQLTLQCQNRFWLGFISWIININKSRPSQMDHKSAWLFLHFFKNQWKNFNDSVWDVEWKLRAWFGQFKLQNSGVAKALLGHSTMVSFSQSALWKVFCHHQLFLVLNSCWVCDINCISSVLGNLICYGVLWWFQCWMQAHTGGGLLSCEPLKHAQYSGSWTIADALFCYSVEKYQILQRQIFSIKILYFCYFRVGVFWYVRVTNLKFFVTWGVTICYETTLPSPWRDTLSFCRVSPNLHTALVLWYPFMLF